MYRFDSEQPTLCWVVVDGKSITTSITREGEKTAQSNAEQCMLSNRSGTVVCALGCGTMFVQSPKRRDLHVREQFQYPMLLAWRC